MKMILYLIIILNNGNDLKLHKITSNEILSCSLWYEKNIIYKENEKYCDGCGEIWIKGYYKDYEVAGYICEKGAI